MKKQVKGIIGLGAVLVLLGGGYAALRLTDPDKNDSGESSAELLAVDDTESKGEGVLLISDNGEEATVSEAFVKNETDELHVIMLTEPTDTSAATYTLDGYQDLDMNTAVIGTLVNNGNGLTSLALIEENSESLEKFGLAEPAITVDFIYESGTERTLYIGDNAPSGSGVYVMTDESTSVYTASVSALANYSKTLNEFVEKTVLEEPAEEDYPIIKSLKIEREDLDYDILIEYDELSDDEGYTGGTSATHVMVEPIDCYLTVERSSDITNGMFGLNAEDIYALHCQESDIAQAGLSEPFCKVTMSCDDGNVYVLLLSEIFTDDDGKHCYGMLEGGNVIYVLSPDDAKWVTVLPIDIASKIMIASYVWNVSDLSVKCSSGDEESFHIALNDDSISISDAKAEDFTVTKNGKAFDTERYRQFYSFLVSTNAEEFALGEDIPDSEPMATLTYTDSYTGKTTTIDFYDYSSMKALIAVDGKSKFFCTKSYVNTLIENVKRINTGEDYKTTW